MTKKELLDAVEKIDESLADLLDRVHEQFKLNREAIDSIRVIIEDIPEEVDEITDGDEK